MGEILSKDFTERISYPSSSYQLKEITMATIMIYKCDHILSDNIEIPKSIKKNKFIINFPRTNNKCVFFCIAYHLEESARPDRMMASVKDRVKEYCTFKGIKYSAKYFKEMQPIDTMEFDQLEDCFQLAINVFEMDQNTLEISKLRESEKAYENVINILDYKGHAIDIAEWIKEGGCECDDKIRCICGLGKGLFPYEYIKSFDVLSETTIPAKSAFDSSLRGTSISANDYERVKFVWEHYEMKSIKDLLIWYNNLDVKPFVQAIQAQRELFKRFKLDIFTDGDSLPGLGEKVMYQTCFTNPDKRPRVPAKAFDLPEQRYLGYIEQDKKADREFGMTMQHLDELLEKQKYLCGLCYCQLTAETASADRINNKLGHEDGNILISCIACNVARKEMPLKAFRRKKLLEFNADKLVWSIDKEEEAEIYHKMKANVAGGPSIIFNRYGKRNETKIRGGQLCKKVIGYGANTLYLWALGNEMPCGRLTTIDANDDKIFGFLECDIRTPEHLKDYFSEMTPIFKNVEINCNDENIIGKHMFDYKSRASTRAKPARKLIGSYFGEKILIYTPLLKWYLAHGMEITKTYSFIKASSHRAFKPFMDDVSNDRREGDVHKIKTMIVDLSKLIGNAAFGRSGMDKSKHKEVTYESNDKTVRTIIEKQNFHNVVELAGSYEVSLKKRKIKLINPIHLSIAIYQLAKLRMLQFYYDCIDYYFDRSDYQYQEMDTDSAYIAFSCEKSFEQCIKPELEAHFKEHKYDWFPRDFDDEVAKFDRRTPGLVKDEWSGDAMVSLSYKNYICYMPDEQYKVKVSAKGVQQGHGRKKDVLNQEGFESVVKDQITLSGTNKGFRICKETQGIITYTQQKTARSYWYHKRAFNLVGFAYGKAEGALTRGATVKVKLVQSGRWAEEPAQAVELLQEELTPRAVSAEEALNGVGTFVGGVICTSRI
ncbi:hypothetical protein PHYSODRAFT_259644 [Phytophthora sojae]|uniref:DNA-directed DNA polymerase n=1 Tax=Phytophthora sojae (strain P6497) TaxID=1094619 RepID=G4ZBM4_PHYSP|nr:hypothetical protein PHYSODRAFT_259644 [Phytophthora sojae]EGZ20638.1 hypothetical protein PHYSODRAFT_259644 [Phytophthora sojae]|eukprot:XP_009523355.1 hypothetical protein PHYSODRAFT_259644 [Phytophthora sojae]